jgi:hypothetical protein
MLGESPSHNQDTYRAPSGSHVAAAHVIPRFRRGTFSYGITTSPIIKDRVGDIETLHAYAC